MAEVVQFQIAGITRSAVEVEFDAPVERWNEYTLVDGGRVRFRATATKIFRILDAAGKPAFLPDGNPHYFVRYVTQVVGSA